MDPRTEKLTVGCPETEVDFDYRGATIWQNLNAEEPSQLTSVFIPWDQWDKLRAMIDAAHQDAKVGGA